jgi:hypothetical protein
VTKITPQALALVEVAGKEWARHKMLVASVEARVRARVEAEAAQERDASAYKVALAMGAAIDGGATKAALRPVTTRDFRTFKSYFDLLSDAPTTSDEAVKPVSATVTLWIEWYSAEVLRLGLEPGSIAVTGYDRTQPDLWCGNFEVYRRPDDGQVFIDPTGDGGFEVGIAVTEWLRADAANLDRVVAWIDANPQA